MQGKYWTIVIVLTAGAVITFIYTNMSFTKIFHRSFSIGNGRKRNRFQMNQKREDTDIFWTYDCANGYCVRNVYKSGKRISLKTCSMVCGIPQLWPYPKVVIQKDQAVYKFCINDLHMVHDTTGHIQNMLNKAYKYMYNNIERLVPDSSKKCNLKFIKLDIRIETSEQKLLLKTSEEYNLTVSEFKDNIGISLVAGTYFGARHGLETLYQLIWWDDIEQSLTALSNIHISDAPRYPYRGLMLDTGSNYFSVKSILKTLTGMSANKLNIFHWHITDFGSFPFQAPSYPNLSKYGAYDDTKIYTPQDIKTIVNFAKFLGIRVIIEIDAPGHMLAGWEAMEGEMVVFKKDNVTGEMNPQIEVFAILSKLYEDIINLTEEEELFHIGGHPYQKPAMEYNTKNYPKSIRTIYSNLKKLNRTKYTILWSNNFEQTNSLPLLNSPATILQITSRRLSVVNNYKCGIVFSDEDNWSLGCGLGFWTPLKSDPCLKYRTWQNVYMHDPWEDYEYQTNLIYGGEIMLWSVQVDEDTLDNILWPRTAAFAENIWKGASNYDISPDVFIRLDTQRERLEHLGLDSSVMWPEWCTLNPNSC